MADRKAGDIDFWIVRENTEGEYSSIGGKIFEGTDRETVIQETVMTRTGIDRVLRYAFDLAQSRPRKRLTSATKSNGISITMPYWDSRVREMALNYPDVNVDKYHIDILTAHFVQRPNIFDVVVGSNLFGDILSDLGKIFPISKSFPAVKWHTERSYQARRVPGPSVSLHLATLIQTVGSQAFSSLSTGARLILLAKVSQILLEQFGQAR